jgi:UDP-N-acetylmuramate--alanine ligase
MIGWILREAGMDPTVMNGAVMKNFVTDETPLASALVGGGDMSSSEVDESDGSIALYEPRIAVLNNVTLDHKSIDELRRCSSTSSARPRRVLNLDDDETRCSRACQPEDASPSASTQARFSGSDVGRTACILRPPERSGETCGPLRCRAPQCATRSRPPRRRPRRPCERRRALGGFTACAVASTVVGTRNGISRHRRFRPQPDKIGATLDTLMPSPAGCWPCSSRTASGLCAQWAPN